MSHLRDHSLLSLEPGRASLVLRGAPVSVRNAADLLRGVIGADSLLGAIILTGAASAAELGLPVFADLSAAQAAAGGRGLHVIACDADSEPKQAEQLLFAASEIGAKIFALETGARSAQLRPWGLHDLLLSSYGQVDVAALKRALAGRKVLVTGAGGSIGSALCHQLASLGLSSLVLLDNCEFNLFRIDQSLRMDHPQLRCTPILCDIREGEGVRRQFERERPDFVLHVAALKHVPIVEANACEGVLTNVLGARNVANAARAIRADMIFVSTDKAVSPSSIMGATKRIGEMLCAGLDCEGESRLVSVRLGNVLGSAGSVTPVFEHQIARGGPVTVTDAAVSRYFITIPRAAEFILSAAAFGLSKSAQRGAVHVLEMGAPVAVVDLARMMIRLAGKRPDRDIAISYVGLRPGEKLCEQLVAEDERVLSTVGREITAVAGPPIDLRALERDIERVISLARSGQDDMVRVMVHRMAAAAGEKAAIAS